jgi:hypothetical protein
MSSKEIIMFWACLSSQHLHPGEAKDVAVAASERVEEGLKSLDDGEFENSPFGDEEGRL